MTIYILKIDLNAQRFRISEFEMNESVESSFIDKGTHYKISLNVQQADTFSIILLDEDQTDRWEGIFNGQTITNLTTRVGYKKKVQIFFKMLQNAILRNSDQVSFNILTNDQIEELKGSSSQSSEQNTSVVQSAMRDSRYLILVQQTEYEIVRYPLRLLNKPFSVDELKGIIRLLKGENKRLANSEQANSQRERVQALEQQIYDLNGSIRHLAEEKDSIIANLRQQIENLEEKARVRASKNAYGSIASRQKNLRNNSGNNSTNIRSNYGNHSRNTPSSQKKSGINSGITRSGISSSKYRSNIKNSRNSSGFSSAAGSRKSSAVGSRQASANGSRRNSALGSARSSAANSRPSSRSSNGSFKRFNPTEWVNSRKSSRGNSASNSRNASRNQSPAYKPSKRVLSNKGVSPTNAHLKRLRTLMEQKYP